jgi:hypothetical protein
MTDGVLAEGPGHRTSGELWFGPPWGLGGGPSRESTCLPVGFCARRKFDLGRRLAVSLGLLAGWADRSSSVGCVLSVLSARRLNMMIRPRAICVRDPAHQLRQCSADTCTIRLEQP